MKTITQAIKFIFENENIQSKEDLQKWCSTLTKFQKLYSYIEELAPDHWNSLDSPKATARGIFQRLISGYKKSKTSKPKEIVIIKKKKNNRIRRTSIGFNE